MDIREYADEIVKSLNIEGTTAKEVEKANGVVLTGIIIPTESNVSPTIYINKMMEEGLTPEEAATEVLRVYNANRITNFDLSFVDDYEKVKPRLRARLYNTKTSAEIRRSAEKYGFDDLIIVPYIEIGEIGGKGNGSVRVDNNLKNRWNVTDDDIIDIAIENTKGEAIIKSMYEVLKEMMIEMDTPSEQLPMYIITNKNKLFGAIQVCFEKGKLEEMFPNGYIVLPSSVHEVIVIPMEKKFVVVWNNDYKDTFYYTKKAAEQDIEDTKIAANITGTVMTIEDYLKSMVNDVNDSQVAVEEQLGSKAYIF